ncbi:MAG: MaoC family dehydratase [Candidatus Sulfotelmatobacter sp.]
MGYPTAKVSATLIATGDILPLILETPYALKDLLGREVATTEWVVVSQEQIRQFADVTDDRQWIHVDRERANHDSPYGTTIAHGFLTLSLLSMFLRDAIKIQSGVRMSVNYGLNRVRFPAPVATGARIRARFTLQSIKELTGALEAVFHATIETEGTEKPCCIAEWVLRYYL